MPAPDRCLEQEEIESESQNPDGEAGASRAEFGRRRLSGYARTVQFSRAAAVPTKPGVLELPT